MAERLNPDPCGNSVSSVAAGDCYLENTRADRHVWLMKCPPVVARAMQSQYHHPPLPFSLDPSATAGKIIAKVVVAVDPLLPSDGFSSTQFKMELAGTDDRSMPKCYTMDMSTDFVPMSVFSESSQGKPSVEGKIYHKFDMKPDNAKDYANHCRERTNKYMTRTRQIQVIDDDSGLRMRSMPGIFDVKSFGSVDRKKVSAKASETKRTRRDPEEMEKIMFKLFEKQPNWTLKQLIQETDQPEQFLKDMLKVLCIYNNKGANQGTYELKAEYQRSEDKSDTQ